MMNKCRLIFILLIFLSFPIFAQRIEQRLSWNVENAFRYEIILQRMEAGRFVPYLVDSTTVQSLTVSLFPGFYRFLVIPYDVLDRASKESDWIYFQVTSLQPETEEEITETEEERREREREAYRSLPPLSARIGAAWMPFLPIHGEMTHYNSLSMNIHVGFISKTDKNIKIGTEMAVFRYSLDSPHIPLIDFQYNTDLSVNMLALIWAKEEKAAFVFKIGALFPIEPSGRSLQFNVGAAVYWRLNNILFLETGCDYSTLGSNGFLRPNIGLSLIF